MLLKKKVKDIFENKRVLILGFGKEGKSTFKFLQNLELSLDISIADQDENLASTVDQSEFKEVKFILGGSYLSHIDGFDIIIKTPGIQSDLLKNQTATAAITSQTELFLHFFRERTIGITGTKGKSTTTSLIHHILQKAGKKSFLAGNIGIPPLDFANQIEEDAVVVFEMSSHQLHNIKTSPGTAVFLNLFEEHLDHYAGFDQYKQAKLNILKFQKEHDYAIINADDPALTQSELNSLKSKLLSFSRDEDSGAELVALPDNKILFRYQDNERLYDFSERSALPGDHNMMNIMAALCVCKLAGIEEDYIEAGINSFKGLKHRLEYLGKFNGIHFYNDSIATIPEATIEALKTLREVDTLILGGKDRGINYSMLENYLARHKVKNIILTGEAGQRIGNQLNSLVDFNSKVFKVNSYSEIPDILRKNGTKNGICLLSPAASSYDMFRNFEERGEVFKKIAENL